MGSGKTHFSDLLEQSINFEYCSGGVTEVRHLKRAARRLFPETICSHISGGELNVIVDDKTEFTVRDGQAWIMQGDVLHTLRKISPGPLVSRWCHFRITVLENFDLFKLFDVPCCFSGQSAEQLAELCESLALLKQEKTSIEKMLKTKVYGYKLFLTIISLSSGRRNLVEFVDKARRFTPLLKKLRNEPQAQMSLKDMARTVNLSPSRFQVLFKEAFGMSPCRYSRRIQLDHARNLLYATDKPVAEIALESGYDDPYHFSKAFKKEFFLSPRAYRQEAEQI